ncbi:Modulator of FtsH protease HflC [Fundidesulfovibrio magnetotacticus]|uniref:Protein HflC n=1 Tax=Fundidesulfovibrio magnetotacticus TaxID=2730080 RepID=A0A6V8LT89_9BACT|nr:protease modulator HflC [Fundidesulfovibrio magnetotacticus]GFK95682.1 Modulator of FtsH protease HflC [Fundidesulfovibrio magnetotacticus]
MRRLLFLGIGAALAAIVALQSVFTVDEGQQAIVLQLGKPVRDTLGPGLHFKIPFIQNVAVIDSRVLNYEANPADVLTKDKKTLLVDNFAKWRIVNPLQFYRTLRTTERAKSRLDDLIYAEVRVAIGSYTMEEVVSSRRAEIMAIVTSNVNDTVKNFGLQIMDVRVKRTDLPPQNEKAIFGRMRAERERQAKLYRSEGQEEAAKIKSGADRERTVLLAEAAREAEVLRGQGDAEATATYAASLGRSPEFYSFMRSLEAYRKSFKDNARVIMTPGSGYMKYLK